LSTLKLTEIGDTPVAGSQARGTNLAISAGTLATGAMSTIWMRAVALFSGTLDRLSVPARVGHLARWSYVCASDRDLRLDFLRGLCVLVIVIDHIAGDSPLRVLTGGNRFATSAAEGFVFISGVVVGVVYLRMVQRASLGTAVLRLLERAWVLYLIAVGLTLLVLPVSERLGLGGAQGVPLGRPVELVWRILMLHQTYYLVDVPLLYTLLLFAAPLALVLLW